MDDRIEAILDNLCTKEPLLIAIIALSAAAFVYSVITLFVVGPDSPEFVISIVNIGGLTALISGFGYVVWRCHQI